MGPAPPQYTSHTPPHLLLLLFPSMTPPPRYMSPSLSRGVMGPLPAPRPASQSTPRLPVPTTSSPAVPSIAFPCPSTVCPSSWAGWRPCLLLGLEHRVLHADVSLGLGGLTPGVSAAVESPRTCPRDYDVGPPRRQALLAAAATATALINTASLPPALSIALMPTGFRHYGLLEPRSEGPTLPWNQSHGGGGGC